MMKKILCSVLSAVLAIAAFSGCNKISDLDANSSSGSSSQAAIDASADSFNVTTEVNELYTAKQLGALVGNTEGYTFKYADNDTEKKFTVLGKNTVELVVLDPEGKEKKWLININNLDTTSPVFSGVKTIEARTGDTIDFKSGVSANDNYDGKVDFRVSYSEEAAKAAKPGKYTVTYSASDSSGNVASMKALLNITGEALPEADDSSKGDSSSEGETQTATQATTKAVPANGISENVKFYQDRVVIAGDSVAYGFCAYGYVPYEHNIAKGSTALRQYDDKSLFTFDPTGKELGFVDAIEAVKPSLLYISMGMNDVNLIDAEKYVQRYKELIEKVKNKVPDCVIVTAAITPITQASKFTNIENIRTFNTALKKMVEELKDPNVVFFDAYNAIVGPDGIYIPNDYSPSDGVHVAGHCYKTLLEKLALTLDQYDMKKKIEDIEAKRK